MKIEKAICDVCKEEMNIPSNITFEERKYLFKVNFSLVELKEHIKEAFRTGGVAFDTQFGINDYDELPADVCPKCTKSVLTKFIEDLDNG